MATAGTTITDDDIFFGSERCYFRHVPGSTKEFTCYTNCQFASETSQLQLQAVNLSRKHQIENQKYPVVVPGIPAIDIIPHTQESNQKDDIKEHTQYSNSFPDILKRPLIKCPPHHPDCLHVLYGVKSGVRSGLIKYEGCWYRLKGCGNGEEGFIIRDHVIPSTASSSDKETWQEMRGCAFYNTSLRELYYTSLLSSCPRLQSHGIVSANEAVGLSHYTHPSEALFGTQPLVQPVCILETTKGDRRLGSHVLAGLELILPLLLDVKALNIAKLQSTFPPNRPRDYPSLEGAGAGAGTMTPDSTSFPTGVVSTDRFICDYCLGTSMVGGGGDPHCQGLCWPDAPRDASTMANLLLPSHTLPERAPVVCPTGTECAQHTYPQQWTNGGPVDMSPAWQAIWDDTCATLATQLRCLQSKTTVASTTTAGKGEGEREEDREGESLGIGSTQTSAVLAYLYACAGYDAGNFLRGR